MEMLTVVMRSGWLMAWWMLIPAGAVAGAWALIAALRLGTRE